jgi:hypothetical protein
MSFELEPLALPTEYSLGRLTVYRAEDREPYAGSMRVEIPRNAKLYLDLSQEVCADLSRIRTVPERLLERSKPIASDATRVHTRTAQLGFWRS